MPNLVPRLWGQAKVKIRYLRERDGSACHLCGRMMDFDRRHQPMSATVDHLKPRSQGGGDHPSNFKLAHKRCNEARGNMSLEQWFSIPPITLMPIYDGLAGEQLTRRRQRELIRSAARQGMVLEFLKP